MELDSKLREEFPYLTSLFSEYPLKEEGGDGFSLGDPSSPKGDLLHYLHHLDLLLPINGSSLSSLNPHHCNDHLDHHRVSIEGSSRDPFLGNIPSGTTCSSDLEALASAFPGDHLNTNYLSAAYNFWPDGEDHRSSLLHGSQRRLFWDYPKRNKRNPFDHDDQKLIEPLKFDDLESMVNSAPVDHREVSCVTADSGHQKEADDPSRKGKKLQTKKVHKVYKKANIIKGQWTPQEDRLLVQMVQLQGLKKWSEIAKMLDGRVGKQCRERWHNHLRPDIKKDAWSKEEDEILIQAHKEMGNKWAEIAKRLPGRTENTVKNHWNATVRKQFSRSKVGEVTSNKNTLLQTYIKTILLNNSTSSINDQDNNTSSTDTYTQEANNYDAKSPPINTQNPNIIDTSLEHYSSRELPLVESTYNYGHSDCSEVLNFMDSASGLFDDNYGFVSFLEHHALACGSMVDESNNIVSLELDGLMRGGDHEVIKKEMDLMEMIAQGSHQRGGVI